MTTITFSVDVDAPAQRVFNAVVDWRGQDLWVPPPTVRPGKQGGSAVGGGTVSFTHMTLPTRGPVENPVGGGSITKNKNT